MERCTGRSTECGAPVGRLRCLRGAPPGVVLALALGLLCRLALRRLSERTPARLDSTLAGGLQHVRVLPAALGEVVLVLGHEGTSF